MKLLIAAALLCAFSSAYCQETTPPVHSSTDAINSTVTPPVTTAAVTNGTAPVTTSPETQAPPNTTAAPLTTPTPLTPPTPATPATPATANVTTVSPTSTPNVTSPVHPTTPIHPDPTGSPSQEPERHFDALSFVGGIILSLGCLAILYVGFKFYKARTERNYHTL